MQFLFAFSDRVGVRWAELYSRSTRWTHYGTGTTPCTPPNPPTKTYMRLNGEGLTPVATSPVATKITDWVVNPTCLIRAYAQRWRLQFGLIWSWADLLSKWWKQQRLFADTAPDNLWLLLMNTKCHKQEKAALQTNEVNLKESLLLVFNKLSSTVTCVKLAEGDWRCTRRKFTDTGFILS